MEKTLVDVYQVNGAVFARILEHGSRDPIRNPWSLGVTGTSIEEVKQAILDMYWVVNTVHFLPSMEFSYQACKRAGLL